MEVFHIAIVFKMGNDEHFELLNFTNQPKLVETSELFIRVIIFFKNSA